MSEQKPLSFYFKDSDMSYIQSLMAQNGIPESEILKLPLKSPKTARKLSIFLGFFAVDRFYSGNYPIAVIKLFINCAGFWLIWWIIDWFLIENAIKDRNLKVVMSVLDTEKYKEIPTTMDKAKAIAKNPEVHKAVKDVWQAHKDIIDSFDINK